MNFVEGFCTDINYISLHSARFYDIFEQLHSHKDLFSFKVPDTSLESSSQKPALKQQDFGHHDLTKATRSKVLAQTKKTDVYFPLFPHMDFIKFFYFLEKDLDIGLLGNMKKAILSKIKLDTLSLQNLSKKPKNRSSFWGVPTLPEGSNNYVLQLLKINPKNVLFLPNFVKKDNTVGDSVIETLNGFYSKKKKEGMLSIYVSGNDKGKRLCRKKATGQSNNEETYQKVKEKLIELYNSIDKDPNFYINEVKKELTEQMEAKAAAATGKKIETLYAEIRDQKQRAPKENLENQFLQKIKEKSKNIPELNRIVKEYIKYLITQNKNKNESTEGLTLVIDPTDGKKKLSKTPLKPALNEVIQIKLIKKMYDYVLTSQDFNFYSPTLVKKLQDHFYINTGGDGSADNPTKMVFIKVLLKSSWGGGKKTKRRRKKRTKSRFKKKRTRKRRKRRKRKKSRKKRKKSRKY